MDQLSKEDRESIKKLNNNRLRGRLIRFGVEEELVFSTERDELLKMLAEHMLTPQPTPGPQAPPAELLEVRMRELELRERNLQHN